MDDRLEWVCPLPSGEEWDRLTQQLHLSARQAEVVRALLEDMTVDGIARQLGIQRDTVKTYLKRCYERLHVKSRVQLALRIMSASTELAMSASTERAAPPPGDTRTGGLRRLHRER
jgi:DNA-binding CsgD family transcriptional regulator